jgi:hypothetical protein
MKAKSYVQEAHQTGGKHSSADIIHMTRQSVTGILTARNLFHHYLYPQDVQFVPPVPFSPPPSRTACPVCVDSTTDGVHRVF